jgi:hypothetical protein
MNQSGDKNRCTSNKIIYLMAACAVVCMAITAAYVWHQSRLPQGRNSGPILVDIGELSDFELDQQGHGMPEIPQKCRDLDGKQIIFSAQMWEPQISADGLVKQFEARDPKVKYSSFQPRRAQNCWVCEPSAGVKIDYTDMPVRITGRFHVVITRDMDNNRIWSVFHVDVDEIQAAPGKH